VTGLVLGIAAQLAAEEEEEEVLIDMMSHGQEPTFLIHLLVEALAMGRVPGIAAQEMVVLRLSEEAALLVS
jgi:hypothetical protein